MPVASASVLWLPQMQSPLPFALVHWPHFPDSPIPLTHGLTAASHRWSSGTPEFHSRNTDFGTVLNITTGNFGLFRLRSFGGSGFLGTGYARSSASAIRVSNITTDCTEASFVSLILVTLFFRLGESKCYADETPIVESNAERKP